MKMYRRYASGFTLVEMAIVLVIIGLLLGGMLMPLSAQLDQRRNNETQKALEEITQALLGFVIANGRLPCPADPAGTGLEDTNGLTGVALACTNVNGVGVLPWATLGVNETDAWGRRYTYRVTLAFARGLPRTLFADFFSNVPAAVRGTCNEGTPAETPPTIPVIIPQTAAFALCSQGDMTVKASAAGNTIASNLPAVVISHGINGNGAYTSQGTQLATGSDADEQDNQLTGGGTSMVNTTFVSKTPTTTYDDLVAWLSPNLLFNRMVAAGKLP